jgi:VanZ family protein
MMSKRTLAVLWTVGILAACTVPGEYIPNVPVLSPDKIVHFLFFAGFGWLWTRAFPGRPWLVLAGGLAFGIFIEIWQQTMPIGRRAEVWDVVADMVGLIFILLVIQLIQRRRSDASPTG